MIRALGFPDLSEATYGQLHVDHAAHDGLDDAGLRRFGLYGQNGNAWLLKKDDDGTLHCMFCSGQLLRITSGVPDPKSRAVRGRFERCSIKKDLRTLAQGLEEISDKPYRMPWNSLPPLLMLAAQAYHAGYKDEANQIANRIFTLLPPGKRHAFMEQLISNWADAKLAEATFDWTLTQNREAYRKRLETLVSQFSHTWKQADAATAMGDRLAMSPLDNEPKPASSAQKTAANALASLQWPRELDELGNWLLLPPRNIHSMNSELLHFITLRKNALPVLMQWLDDYRLCPPFTQARAVHPAVTVA